MARKKNQIKAPQNLIPEAKEWWDKYVPVLYEQLNLNENDLMQMEFLAVFYGNYKFAYKELLKCNFVTEYKNGTTQLSQYHSMLIQNISAFNSLAKEYGLTPLSKSKLNNLDKSKNDKETYSENDLKTASYIFHKTL